MCIKNHVALRDYARHLLKYMENPLNNQNLLNIKLNRADTESNGSDIQDRAIESENDSDYSEENPSNIKEEIPHEDLNNPLEEPLALVKSDRRNQAENSENSQQLSTHTSDDRMTDIKTEDYSDDDSDYQCEDLSKKPRLVIDEDRDSDDIPQQNTTQNLLPGYNAQNDVVMNYLKLDYSDKDNINHTNSK